MRKEAQPMSNMGFWAEFLEEEEALVADNFATVGRLSNLYQ
jgi:hypothetical protein